MNKIEQALRDLKDLKSVFIAHCWALKCEDDYIKLCENKFINIEGILEQELDSLASHIKSLKRENDELRKKLEIASDKKNLDEKKIEAFNIIKNTRVLRPVRKCINPTFYNLVFDQDYVFINKDEYELLVEVLK